ncbi:MAG: hypothetical protein AB1505_06805 [Candidatus Latescibacterota bacterium]
MPTDEVTCGAQALDFCTGIIAWATSPETHFVDERFRISGWLRASASALASIARFAGRLTVVPHRAGRLRVRVPSYASPVEVTVDGQPAPARRAGSYVLLDPVPAESRVELTYPLPERTTEETTMESPGKDVFAPKSDPVVKERIRTTWRGNTVLAIDYDADSPRPRHRLFAERMERYRAQAGRGQRAAFFRPERDYQW